MTHPFTITDITPDRWELLRATRLAALADAPTAFASTYENESVFTEAQWRVRAAESAWFVAASEVPVGVIALAGIDPATQHSTPITLVPTPAALKIFGMWVHADVRGSILARKLIQHAAAFAADHGVAHLTLGAFTDNARAMRFYERCGFQLVGSPQVSPAQPERTYVDMAAPVADLVRTRGLGT